MANLKELKRKRDELEHYIHSYENWRKKFYDLKFKSPTKYKAYIEKNSGGKSIREWITQREAKVDDYRKELENVNLEIKRFDYVQPLVITTTVVLVVLMIGTIAITAPTGFAVAERNVNDELFINIPSTEDIVVEKLVFGENGPTSCNDLEISSDRELIEYSVVHATYTADRCSQAYVVFNNVNHKIKNSRYKITVL